MKLTDKQTEIIDKLLDNAIEVWIYKDCGKYCFRVYGFSKTGRVSLIPTSLIPGPAFTAYSRYDTVTEINDFSDLLNLNYEWYSKYRLVQAPHNMWEPLLIEAKLITKTETTLVEYK